MLKADGWWKAISGFNAEHITALKSLTAVTTNGSRAPLKEQGPLLKTLADAFVSVLPHLENAVWTVTSSVKKGELAGEFAKLRPHVEACLRNGIVPSAVLDGSVEVSPIAVLNAAYVFRITQLATRMRRLADQNKPEAGPLLEVASKTG